MANPYHVRTLLAGADEWNTWRESNADIRPDLERAALPNAHLIGRDLVGADLRRAYLGSAYLDGSDLREANLNRANLGGARLRRTNLGGSDLRGAELVGADLSFADLTNADLSGAYLSRAHLVDTRVEGAIFEGVHVYGVAVWNLEGTPGVQRNLTITPHGEAHVTVDDLEVAQFMYLMLNNENVRTVIDTITSKVVLILGRFTPERKRVLDALRDELRTRNLTPILFDFDMPADRDITETVTLLARMARFIIADLTDPVSIPMELQAIAPDVAVPIRSIVHEAQEPFGMFTTLKKYHWVLPPYRYGGLDDLIANLDAEVIAPADAKREEIASN